MHKEYHTASQPIPVGYQLYEERLEVAGIQYRRSDAQTFTEASGQWLEFELDPSNSYDRNAIKINGCWNGFWGTNKHHVGYVPKEKAARIAETGLIAAVKPRLLKTYVGHDGFTEILFQIIGPKEHFSTYRPPIELPFANARALAKSGDTAEAIARIMIMVDEAEDEARANGYGVTAGPYLELAKHYRKLKRYDDEVAILERFDKQHKARGARQDAMAERLFKARALRDKST